MLDNEVRKVRENKFCCKQYHIYDQAEKTIKSISYWFFLFTRSWYRAYRSYFFKLFNISLEIFNSKILDSFDVTNDNSLELDKFKYQSRLY